MGSYRIERTEFHTRVWIVEATDEDSALEEYTEQDPLEAESYHSGCPDVRIVVNGEER